MRELRLGLIVLVSACSTDLADPPKVASSVRERLHTETRLWIGPADSAGAITAERRTTEGWTTGVVDLGVENGELILSSIDDHVAIEGLQVSFAPFALPQGLFGGKTAQLTNVRLDLLDTTHAPGEWISNNEVHFSAALDLELSWTLALDGSPAPLGSPTLPPVPVDVVVTGDGAHVTAELRAHAPGELWNWANLLKLGELQLTVGAAI